MNQEKKKILSQYLGSFFAASLMVFIVLAINGFNFDGRKNSMQLLHNAFFSSGALMVLFAGLLYVASEGAFLGIGFALKSALRVFIPDMRRKPETYAEYRDRKGVKKRLKPDRSIFLTGLFFILISVIFLIIWYQL